MSIKLSMNGNVGELRLSIIWLHRVVFANEIGVVFRMVVSVVVRGTNEFSFYLLV